MKKIKNTAGLGRLIMGLNLAIMVLFIVTMIFLSKFDKINVVYVKEKVGYNQASEKVHKAELPIKQNVAELKYYQHKLDTLLAKPTPKERAAAKKLSEDILATKAMVAEKQQKLSESDSTLAATKASYEPIQKKFTDLEQQQQSAKSTYNLVLWLTIALMVIKIAIFAFYNWQNIKNLLSVTKWMKKGSHPAWAFVGWIIPFYNFIKPYAFFSEIWNDSDYLLKDKGIIPNDGREDNADFNLGLWWSLFLICTLLVSWVLSATFMSEGPMFLKMSHTGVIVAATILWALYLAQECNLIRLFNKKNKLMLTIEE
jgi:hypothetical protein